MTPSVRCAVAFSVLLPLSSVAAGQGNPNVVPPPPEVRQLQLTRPFTLVYRADVSSFGPASKGGSAHNRLRLTMSYDGTHFLYQSADLDTGVTSTSLFDGRDTYTADSNSRIAQIAPGFWYDVAFRYCPLPGVALPYKAFANYGVPSQWVAYMTNYLAPQLAREKALVAPELYNTRGRVRYLGSWSNVDLPGAQAMSYFTSIVVVPSEGAPKALWYETFNNASSNPPDPGELWEFFDHRRFEGLWIAGKVRERRYGSARMGAPSALWREATYTLESSTPGPLEPAAYNPATYLPPYANITDFTGPKPRAFVYHPEWGSLQEQRGRGEVAATPPAKSKGSNYVGIIGFVLFGAASVVWFVWRRGHLK